MPVVPTKIGSEFQVNTYTVMNQAVPFVASLTNNDFVVTWGSDGQDGDNYGIYGQVFDGSTGKIGTEVQMNTYTTAYQGNPSVATLPNGNFVAVWASVGQDGDLSGVYGQVFNRNIGKIGSEFQVNTYTRYGESDPSVSPLPNGNFVVVWQSDSQDGDNYGIYGQVFDGSAGKIGTEFQVNTYTTSYQGYPSVATLPNGNFVVVWSSDGQDGDSFGIYGQVFDGSVGKIGTEFQVNSYITSEQRYSSVTALPDGSFVVVWQSNGQDGDSFGIYGQVFDGSAGKVGTEFQVNSYITGGQVIPSVSQLSNGHFVVVWHSGDQDGDNSGVYGQVFDGSTGKIGAEFQVNTYTAFSQRSAFVTSLSNGHFVVVWTSSHQDGDVNGVFGQIFDGVLPPSVIVNNFTITEGGSVILTPANLMASDPNRVDTSEQLIYQLTQIQYVTFSRLMSPSMSVSNFSQVEIDNEEIEVTHDGSEGEPIFEIMVSNSFGRTVTAAAEIQFVGVNDAPAFVANQISLTEGQSILLNGANLQVSDPDNLPDQLTYTITNLQGGVFTRETTGTAPITTFTQAEIDAGNLIRLTSDGSETLSFEMIVRDAGGLETPVTVGSVTLNGVNNAPTLSVNDFSLVEDEPLILNATNLSAVDTDNSASELRFMVSGLKNVRFARVNSPGTVITQFTQEEVDAGQIQVVASTNEFPEFFISVSDGAVSTSPVPAQISAFTAMNDVPVLERNEFVIRRGERLQITTSMLRASDEETVNGDLEFRLSQVVGGHFELGSRSGLSIQTFRQQAITEGQVYFVQDVSQSEVSFEIEVSDGEQVTVAVAGQINFITQNSAPQVEGEIPDSVIDVGKTSVISVDGLDLFRDPDGDRLSYETRLADGNALPNWIEFRASGDSLTYNLLPQNSGETSVSLIAVDPYGERNGTEFSIDVRAGGNATLSEGGSSSSNLGAIAGGVVGGAAFLATGIACAACVTVGACLGGVGLWRRRNNKRYEEHREKHPFANALREQLRISGVDDFESDKGSSYVNAVESLITELELRGFQVRRMFPQELKEFTAKISPVMTEYLPARRTLLGAMELDADDLRGQAGKIAEGMASRRTVMTNASVGLLAPGSESGAGTRNHTQEMDDFAFLMTSPSGYGGQSQGV